jgi:hypothetical protein
MATNDVVFREDVQCFVRDLGYDFRTKVGVLYLEDGGCTDMSGCIRLFKKIDPDVQTILTIAGRRRDTAYLRDDDHWRAVSAPDERAPIHGDWWTR